MRQIFATHEWDLLSHRRKRCDLVVFALGCRKPLVSIRWVILFFLYTDRLRRLSSCIVEPLAMKAVFSLNRHKTSMSLGWAWVSLTLHSDACCLQPYMMPECSVSMKETRSKDDSSWSMDGNLLLVCATTHHDRQGQVAHKLCRLLQSIHKWHS